MATPTTVQVQMQLRLDTAANWTSVNPTLLNGEMGLESDTQKIKIGDGSTAWNSLSYFPFLAGGGIVNGNLEIGSTGTLTFEGATVDGFETQLAVTDPTADRTITLPDQSGTVVVSGNASIVDADIATGAEIAVSKLANGTVNQVLVTDGTDVNWSDDLTIAGNLTVNGTTTTVNTETLVVEDKNIELGVVDTPTDTTADGGGITLKGTTDKTINWVDATDAWTSSENIDLATGKSYNINGTEVLSANTLGSGVTSSSLTSIGTLGSLTVTGDAAAGTFIPTSGTAPTNGVYLPATNSVAISTNGTERLSIGSTGQIELTTGAARLDTTTTGSAAAFFNTGANGYIRVTDGTIQTQLQNTGGGGNLVTVTEHPLILKTFNQERLRITSDGKVGLGTSSPDAPLTVRNIAGGAPTYRGDIVLNQSGGISGLNTNGGIEFKINGTNNGYGARVLQAFNGVSAYNFAFQIRNNSATWSTPLLIDSSGRLGVGTTSPLVPLHVVGKSLFTNWIICSNASRGICSAGLDPLVFGINETERARIDSSGRLLVGTSSARSNFNNTTIASPSVQLESVASPRATITSNSVNAVLGAELFLCHEKSGSIGGNTLVASGDSLGALAYQGSDGSEFVAAARIEAFVDGTPGANDMPGRLVFSTTADGASSPTERMRITNNGNIRLNTTSQKSTAIFNIEFDAAGGEKGFESVATGNVFSTHFSFWNNTINNVGSISTSNVSTSYNTSSDYRLKENITPVADGITRLQQLKPSRFNFIADPGTTVDGFLAHEVQDIVPEAITGEKDAVDDEGNPQYQGIDQSKLVPLLTAALQEAIGEIESLKARVAALESA